MDALQWVFSAGTNFFEETQLNNDLDHLKATLPRARTLIYRSEWGMFKKEQLAKLLSDLKDTIYHADDLVRELKDQEQRQKIEDADRSWAGQLFTSSLNLANNYIHGSKGRIKETRDKLDKVVAEIERVLEPMGLMRDEPSSQIMPETSSLICAPEVVGRDGERNALMEMLGMTIGREAQRDQVIEQLGVPLTGDGGRRSAASNEKRAAAGSSVASTSRAKQPKGNSGRAGHAEINCKSNVSVIPIVGIGGVGKTTLAQYIYNDPRVKKHFDVMIWVCVSDFFDKKKITKEIIESITGEKFGPSSSWTLDALHVKLKEQLTMCPKFLLVLDDVWPNANKEWEVFYTPLKHGAKGSMILVTTRSPAVANRVTTSNYKPFQLDGLPADIFWDFFKKCAFGTNDPELYPDLQDIGRSISTRLCGSPLAAKTLGRMLNKNLTEEKWRSIQKSELWELPHEDNEILPALQLSYLYLREEVKRCFIFCSMYPKDYSFERDEIVDIWVAEGFVAPGESMCSDVGFGYLDELRDRCLFQTDPKFPDKNRYVMHDLIHDMALSFSANECWVIQDLRIQNKRIMPSTVRHLSIEVDGETLIRMGDIQYLNKLHSLRFRIGFDVEITWFNRLSNILYLSLKGCRLVKLPESICELNSLRYLDISDSTVQELPTKLWCLYSLQVLDASRSRLKGIHQDVTKLVNLHKLALPRVASQALSNVSGLGNLSCLRNLKDFRVAKKNGRGIGELKFMNQLNGSLAIRSLLNVRSEEEAAEARLVDKQYLKELVLQWRPTLGSLMPSENGVLQCLRPHSRIECLKVEGFSGDTLPSWFKPEDLPALRSLELSHCRYSQSLSTPCFADRRQASLMGNNGTQHASSSISRSNGISSFAFTRLTDLRVYDCPEVTSLEQFLTPEKLPCIKSIVLEYCGNLKSIPVHRFVEFVCLQDLKIFRCNKLECPREMVLPPSLQRLYIVDCNELDRSLTACLENLTSLTVLQLAECKNIKCIPLNSIGSKVLKCLEIDYCYELSSIGGLQGLASIQHVKHVRLSCCRKLTELPPTFETNELRTKEKKELLFSD